MIVRFGRIATQSMAIAALIAMGSPPTSALASPANPICEKVLGGTVCEQDPPGMHYNAVYLQQCNNNLRYIFGRGADGGNLVCAGGGPGGPVWGSAPTLFGEQSPGGACPSWIPGGAAAQTPNGIALICQRGVGWTPNS